MTPRSCSMKSTTTTNYPAWNELPLMLSELPQPAKTCRALAGGPRAHGWQEWRFSSRSRQNWRFNCEDFRIRKRPFPSPHHLRQQQRHHRRHHQLHSAKLSSPLQSGNLGVKAHHLFLLLPTKTLSRISILWQKNRGDSKSLPHPLRLGRLRFRGAGLWKIVRGPNDELEGYSGDE